MNNGWYTDEELLEAYRIKSEQLGRPANTADIVNDPELPARSTFTYHFGGLREVRRLCGYIEGVDPFCDVCLYDPDSCGRDVIECKKETTGG